MTPKEPQGRFDYLNDMLVSMEMHDMATMKNSCRGTACRITLWNSCFSLFKNEGAAQAAEGD